MGLHRTGTTFLQKHVFPRIKGIKYYGRHDNNPYARNYCLLVNDNDDKPILISDEGLSNYNYLDYDECSPYKIADRLKLLFPHAKIIVVFRKKEEWVKSLYNFYVKAGGNKDFNTWRKEIFKDIDFMKYENYLKNLFDDVLVLWYEKLKENPKEFVRDICDFIGAPMSDFDLIWENPSFSERANRAILYVNRQRWIPTILKTLMNRIFKLISATKHK